MGKKFTTLVSEIFGDFFAFVEKGVMLILYMHRDQEKQYGFRGFTLHLSAKLSIYVMADYTLF